MESFFEEDYPSITKNKNTDTSDVSLYSPLSGTFCFSSIANYEAVIPWEEGKEAFFLEVPGDAFHSLDLKPDELLPIIDEYIGKDGSSSKGNIANYFCGGEISSENLACIPFHKSGEHCFATLYFQMDTLIDFPLTLRLTESESDFAVERLVENKFKLLKDKNSNFVFSRGDSIIHFYNNCPGKEDYDRNYLPPFILISQYQNSLLPEKRSLLMKELKKILKK